MTEGKFNENTRVQVPAALQITSIAKQRDELLPLLMNGQATVNSD